MVKKHIISPASHSGGTGCGIGVPRRHVTARATEKKKREDGWYRATWRPAGRLGGFRKVKNSAPTMGVHRGRLTWNLQMMVWKIILLFNWVIFRFHVNLPGCRDTWKILPLSKGLTTMLSFRPPKQGCGTPFQVAYKWGLLSTLLAGMILQVWIGLTVKLVFRTWSIEFA